MTDTDRIAQMAREAGITFEPMTIDGEEYEYLHVRFNDNIGGDEAGCIARFARIVAEDCAGVVDAADTPDGWSNSHISDAIRARYSKEG